MNRRNLIPALAALAAAGAASAEPATDNPMRDLLAASAKDKKGVTLHVHGQQIACLVTNLGLEFVEGRSQAQSRIVVRLTAIDAVTMA
jgi:hypothetical protein